MKRVFPLLVTVLAAVALTSCHSNEANYKEAYDKVIQKRQQGIGLENYNMILAEATRNTHFIAGDSVRMIAMHANVALDSANVVHPYSVVAASFKQRFNAKNYRDRLRDEEGLPAYILYGGPEKKYFVVVKGFDTEELAATFVHHFSERVKMKPLEPKVWILEIPNKRK